MKNNTFFYILLILIIGCILGTALSLIIGIIIPEGVVKDFFILSQSFGFGQSSNNWVNLGPVRFKMGFFFDVSILSLLGFFISWYILRYLK